MKANYSLVGVDGMEYDVNCDFDFDVLCQNSVIPEASVGRWY